jgi:hypothetical protein
METEPPEVLSALGYTARRSEPDDLRIRTKPAIELHNHGF